MTDFTARWHREHTKNFWYKSVSRCCETSFKDILTDKKNKYGFPIHKFVCDGCGKSIGTRNLLLFDSGSQIYD